MGDSLEIFLLQVAKRKEGSYSKSSNKCEAQWLLRGKRVFAQLLCICICELTFCAGNYSHVLKCPTLPHLSGMSFMGTMPDTKSAVAGSPSQHNLKELPWALHQWSYLPGQRTAGISRGRGGCSLLLSRVKTPLGEAAQGHEGPSHGTGFHKQRGFLGSDVALRDACAAAHSKHQARAFRRQLPPYPLV